jgi:hypothetical protein
MFGLRVLGETVYVLGPKLKKVSPFKNYGEAMALTGESDEVCAYL